MNVMIYAVRQRASQFDRLILATIILLASIFPIELVPGSMPAPKGADGQYSGKQGQIVLIKVPGDDLQAEVRGAFLGRTLSFFPDPRNGEAPGYVGLLGLDMQDKPGTHELTVDIKSGDQTKHVSLNVLVVKEKFRVEHLKLPKEKVDLDEKAVARWKAEQDQVKTALTEDSRLRLWQSGFLEPVGGKRTGIFGSMRIMNGQARNPHNGEDIGAPMGTDVLATNDGVVRLTVDHIFSGKGVYVDHGLGFYSMYFHLSEVSVKEGDSVKAGQVVGKIGATGRATGPHLHWGVKLNGARVNPYALLDLPFKGVMQPVAPASVAPAIPDAGGLAP
ncbi:MAG: M23 family metallopeptidase [Nitrospira sp.]|nr:MAG: M23 family metallopeptidase [Nitrospira sp.]